MNHSSRIYVAGHRGLVGSAVLRRLQAGEYISLLTRSRSELDLTRQDQVQRFFEVERPEYVVLAAARVGGILANDTYPADFIRENLLIQTHVIDAAFRHGVKRLLFLGSSCIYPRLAPQPMKEEYLLTGPLEPTNEAYAIAKIAGIKMCQAYRRQHGMDVVCLMPTNLYGPGDNFNLEASHVIPALVRKFHEAKRQRSGAVTLWGTGSPYREFLHVDDLADACFHLLRIPPEKLDEVAPDRVINVGTGQEITIRELAALIAGVVGVEARLEFDSSRPDGQPRKCLDISRASALGWAPRIPLREGLHQTYEWFCRTVADASQQAALRL